MAEDFSFKGEFFMKKLFTVFTCLAAAFLCGKDFPSGKNAIAYQLDKAANSMTVIAETAYDPKKDEGDSVYTLHWNSKTRFEKQTVVPFSTLKAGQVAWLFLTPKEAEKVKQGKSFSSTRINIEVERKARLGFRSPQKLCAPVFPKKGRMGEIEFAGKRIQFTAPAKVNIFSPATVDDIKLNKTPLRIWGNVSEKKFIIGRVSISPVADQNFDSKLPSVLVVGDSISMNYEKSLKAALAGKMNCRRINGNSGDSNRGNSALKLWLGDAPGAKSQWGVVVLNHGLHDLKQKADPKTQKFAPAHQVEPDVYAKNIDRLLKYLTSNKYNVVWCTTTPVPASSYGAYARRKDEDLVYNKVLEPVLKKYPQVVVCDLNAVVRNSKVFDEWRKGNNVHFYKPEEVKLLGDAVAEAVMKAYKK